MQDIWTKHKQWINKGNMIYQLINTSLTWFTESHLIQNIQTKKTSIPPQIMWSKDMIELNSMNDYVMLIFQSSSKSKDIDWVEYLLIWNWKKGNNKYSHCNQLRQAIEQREESTISLPWKITHLIQLMMSLSYLMV